MKKAILVVAIILVALVGLTSYNSNEKRTSGNDDRLLASIKNTTKGDPVIVPIGGNKKPN